MNETDAIPPNSAVSAAQQQRSEPIDDVSGLDQLVVWYNTRCPVCDAGINLQRNRLVQAARAGAIAFRDINQEPDALAQFGVGIEDVRRRLHAVDGTGRLHVGADCAVEIWRRTPGDAWLATLFSAPIIKGAGRLGYNVFADCLYAWNRHRRHW